MLAGPELPPGRVLGELSPAIEGRTVRGEVVHEPICPGAQASKLFIVLAIAVAAMALGITLTRGANGPAPHRARIISVTVPNLAGLQVTAALAKLHAVGFRGSISLMSSSTVPANAVMSQTPAALAHGKPGDLVVLRVSRGPDPRN
jgi:beta-lactam-binding protein with PASTA domain